MLHSFPTVKPGKQKPFEQMPPRENNMVLILNPDVPRLQLGGTFLRDTDFRLLHSKHFMGGQVVMENHSSSMLWAKPQAAGEQPELGISTFFLGHARPALLHMQQLCPFSVCDKLPCSATPARVARRECSGSVELKAIARYR